MHNISKMEQMRRLFITILFVTLYVKYYFIKDKHRFLERKIQELQSDLIDGVKLNFAIAIFNLSILYKDPYFITAAYNELKRQVPIYRLTLDDFTKVYESSICIKDKALAVSLIDNRSNMLKEKLSAGEEQRLVMMHKWRFSKNLPTKDILTSSSNSKYYPWLDNYMRATACEQLKKYDEAKMYYLDALSTMPEEWSERKVIYQRYESF